MSTVRKQPTFYLPFILPPNCCWEEDLRNPGGSVSPGTYCNTVALGLGPLSRSIIPLYHLLNQTYTFKYLIKPDSLACQLHATLFYRERKKYVIIMLIMWLINIATGRYSSCFIMLRVKAAQCFNKASFLTKNTSFKLWHCCNHLDNDCTMNDGCYRSRNWLIATACTQCLITQNASS